MGNKELISQSTQENSLFSRLGNLFSSVLSKPGSRLEAKATNSGRQVIKIEHEKKIKYSATRYPSTGTIVETKVTRYK